MCPGLGSRSPCRLFSTTCWFPLATAARLQALDIAWRSTPVGPDDFQVNTSAGGRIVYWREPDGHAWEALTQTYARAPAA